MTTDDARAAPQIGGSAEPKRSPAMRRFLASRDRVQRARDNERWISRVQADAERET